MTRAKKETTQAVETSSAPETEALSEIAAKTAASAQSAPVGEKSTSRNTVYVFANLPHGQAFSLPGGRAVQLKGWPVSALVGQNGEALPAGRYGMTEVDADDWAEVTRLYGKMAVMRSGLIFSAASLDRGAVMAAERAAKRHGLEQVDPRATVTRPRE